MKRLTRIIIFLIVILLFSVSYVQASSFNFQATASATTVKPGDTITISLGVADIDAGELGINAIEAVLDYDENVFEPVTSESFTGQNNWSITYNDESGENQGKFVAVIVQDGVTEDQQIATITLKVKEGIENQSTAIVFNNIKTNDGTTEIPSADRTININIETPVPEEPEEPQEPVVPEEPQEPTEPEEPVQPVEPEQPDNTESPNKIPQTGENEYVIIALIVVIAMSLISYLLYKKTKIK